MLAGNKALFLVYALLLSTIGLFASDMYLPALGAIQSYFRSDAQSVGLSLSLYMSGFAVAQLFYGALSDQVGRKPPLLAGLTLFLLGTIGCLLATSIELFLAFRLVQAIGVGAAYVLWQPMIFDLFKGEEVQRVFARLMAVGSISPALAPLAGGYLTRGLGWHSVFWVLIGLTAALLLWTAVGYTESLPKHARQPFSAVKVLREYATLARSRFFLGYAVAIAGGIAAYFVFLTMLPLVLSKLGYAPSQIGWMYLPLVASFILGTELSRRYLARLGERGSCRAGAAFGFVGSALLLLSTLLLEVRSAWQLVPPFTLVTFGNGLLMPTGTAYLMKRFVSQAGACASAVGFLVALGAFSSTFLASLFVDEHGVLAMSGTVMLFAAIMLASLLLAEGRVASDQPAATEATA
jgi:MFS transporter, DHA1 family, multidrug resistance protein